jgi:hypothetical protein
MVDLNLFLGKTIQIGFEGVSKYGNAFGIDDIEIMVSPFCSNPPTAFAGSDVGICFESKYTLALGSPAIGGSATAATWVSTGSGSFLGGNGFSSALQYEPSNADKIAGQVSIRLITNNPDTINCLADTASFMLQIRPSNQTIETITVCDSLIWHGEVYRETGSYNWVGRSQLGCDSTRILQLTINKKTIKTDSVQTCLPYSWNGNIYNVSGTYFFTTTNTNGCDSIEKLVLQIESCNNSLNLKAILEGYYIGNGNMRTVLFDLGTSNDVNEVDTIRVLIANNVNAQTQLIEYVTVVKKDGTIDVAFGDSLVGKSFYIGIRSRNHLETWSKNPVFFTNQTFYDFTSSESKALSDGVNPSMKQMSLNTYAFYVGDINADGAIDLFDLQQTENDASQFLFGYQHSDVNGDTTTDLFDLQLVENNSSLFLFSTIPF